MKVSYTRISLFRGLSYALIFSHFLEKKKKRKSNCLEDFLAFLIMRMRLRLWYPWKISYYIPLTQWFFLSIPFFSLLRLLPDMATVTSLYFSALGQSSERKVPSPTTRAFASAFEAFRLRTNFYAVGVRYSSSSSRMVVQCMSNITGENLLNRLRLSISWCVRFLRKGRKGRKF